MLSFRVQSCILSAVVMVIILEMLVFYRHVGYRTNQIEKHWSILESIRGAAEKLELAGEVSTSSTGFLKSVLTVKATHNR